MVIMHDQTIAIGGLDGMMNEFEYYGSAIHIWNAETRDRIQQIIVHRRGAETDAELMDIAFNSTGSEIVSGQNDGTIKFWNVSDGTQIGQFDSHLKSPGVSFSPDDRLLAVHSQNEILVWDTAQNRAYTTIQLSS